MQNAQSTETAREGLATIPEVANYLKVGRSTVYELMNSGEIPAVKVRRCKRVRWSDLEVFIAQQTA